MSEVEEAGFTKSSYSLEPHICVEVALESTNIWVRDSKHRSGPVLSFAPEEWSAFVKGVKNGEFDLTTP